MPDPSDRIRLEPVSRSRAKATPRPSWLRALKPASKRSLAGAALGAVMIGIVVNAVALQHGRRIQPDPQTAATAAVRPPGPAPAPATAASAPAPAAEAREPPRPSPTTVAAAHAIKPGDQIADLIARSSPGADKRRLTLAAQSALAKLGFSVKPTGALDPDTREALADFEKTHHLPVSTEVTAKLVKTLNAAATAN